MCSYLPTGPLHHPAQFKKQKKKSYAGINPNKAWKGTTVQKEIKHRKSHGTNKTLALGNNIQIWRKSDRTFNASIYEHKHEILGTVNVKED